jgi:LPS-assembly protein
MFRRKPILLISATLLFVAYFAFPISSYAEPKVGINTPSQSRPLGVLIAPLSSKRTIPMPDVHSTLRNITILDVQSTSLGQTSPPLGILISPLLDQSRATKADSISYAPQALPLLSASPTVQVNIGADVSPDRPLGLLMDRSTFTPRAKPVSNLAFKNPNPTSVPSEYQVPDPQWNQQGKSPDRPLGNLLIPGSFKPVQYQLAPTTLHTGIQGLNDPSQEEPYAAPSDNSKEPPVDFSANEMSFDRENGIVLAQGNVEIRYKERRLNADIVSYNRETNAVLAEGNVIIVEPNNETIFGEKVEITGDLRNGFIINIGVILQDRSRIVGSSATHTNANQTKINNAVYSPCDLCKDDPNKAPFWQIKAIKIIHNKTRQTINYRDAWIEFFGFPVFYTPYFRHSDPTVKRKSGFLFPTLGNSTNRGTRLKAPYFLNISPSEDATISPIIYSNSAPILSVEYRNRLKNGSYDTNGSLTSNSDDVGDTSEEKGRFGLRGHILSKGHFDINQAWRWGFDGNWTTDDTYMRLNGFESTSTLKSQIYTESFKNRSYFSAKIKSFQNLQAGSSSDEIPLVLPLIDLNLVGKKDRFGGSTNFDLNLLALSRKNGSDTSRLSLRSVWQRPLIGSLGDIYNISLGLNTDLYHVNRLNRGGNLSDYTGFSQRSIPEATFEWRMPFAKSDGETSHVIEPISAFMWSPYGGNHNKIPNEDSIEMEFDDTNLFRSNRFSGLDRVEGGPRLIYGLKWGSFMDKVGKSNIFIGQSWRPKTDDTYAKGSGLEENFSDIVTRMEVSPGPHLKASYRNRIHIDDMIPKRNEVSLSTGIPLFRVSGNYIYMEGQADSEFTGREELQLAATSQIDRYWRSGFNATRDMNASEMRTAGMYLTYEDECVVFVTKMNRSYFTDRDLEPTDSFTFNLVLKTIGQINDQSYILP